MKENELSVARRAKSGEKKLRGKQVAKKYTKSISGDLIGDVRSLIETARQNVAVAVNAGLTILYWQIGSRIRQDILKEKRAEYGKEILATLSQELTKEYGNGFSYTAHPNGSFRRDISRYSNCCYTVATIELVTF